MFIIPFVVLLNLSGQTAVAQTTQSCIIIGTAFIGTTEEPVAFGTAVTLHAYNSRFTNTETMTTTVAADGRFQFSLTDKPCDWVYMVSITYQEVTYSSKIGRLQANLPLTLSLTVYESTSDPGDNAIDSLQLSLNVVGERAQVSELYTFSNSVKRLKTDYAPFGKYFRS